MLLAPLPLGSNRPLPASALSAAVGALLCAWGLGRLVGQPRVNVPIAPFWPAFVLFALAAAWAAVQASPSTPVRLHHPYWSDARAVLDITVAGAISVNPPATRNALMGLLAYGGIFWLGLQLGHPGIRARQVLLALAGGGLLYAAYGLFEAFEAGTVIVTSTFVNRNSYATYAGITLFCGLGLVAHGLARRAPGTASLRRVASHALARLDPPLVLGAVTCLVSGTALLLTQSRGAFVALCAALIAFVWTLRQKALATSSALFEAAAIFSIGVFLGVVWLAGEELLGRFTEAGTLNRLAYYRATWSAIQDRPLLGTGYGTYADAFQAYNHPGTGTYFLDKAHNTYLQMVMELGWPAAAALWFSLGLLTLRALQGLLRQRRNPAYAAVLAACSALVGIHALVDFSLEMPAVAATYALLLGVGCGQSVRGRARPAPSGCDRSGAAKSERMTSFS